MYFREQSSGRIFETSYPQSYTAEDLDQLSDKEGKALLVDQTIQDVKEYLKPDSLVYVICRSVSRSGMTARLSFYVKGNDDLISLDTIIARLTSYKSRSGGSRGIEVHGCNFHKPSAVLDALAYAIYGNNVQFRNVTL